MGRAPCCSKVGLHRGPWTPREDALLTKYIQAHGEGQWRSLPKRAGLLRCGKSCRLRWMNYLRPDIKRGNITPEEDDLIIRMHSLLGNRWSLIAGRLPGRTDNEIKNYWNTHLSKKLRNQGTDPNTHNKLLIEDPVQELANKKKKKITNRGKKKIITNNNKQKKSDDVETERERERKTVVYLPKPIRVAALSLSSSSLSIPRTNSTTFTLESNNSGSAASTRSHEKLEPCCQHQQQQQEEEEEEKELKNKMMVGAVGGSTVNEGELSDEGFGYYFGEDDHGDDLVNGCDDMECQSYYSDFPTDHGTSLDKIYEEYFLLLNMEQEQEQENQHQMDSSFAS